MRKTIPKEKKRRKPSAFKRKIHLKDGSIWSWRMSGTLIVIRSPEGVDHRTDQREVLKKVHGYEVSWDELERADWKGYSVRYAIEPSMIRKIIEEELV
jgi:hypothetical protein